MGSIQSRNKRTQNLVNNDVKIIITGPPDIEEDSDSEDEFFECSSLMMENGSVILKSPASVDSQTEMDDLAIINSNKENQTDSDDSSSERRKRQQRELDEFREEISRKRALRQQCLKKLKDEMRDLNEKLSHQLTINEQLRESIDGRSTEPLNGEIITENTNLKKELAECQLYLQKLNGENLNACIENQALRDHIRSLKEVTKAMKEMLAIREAQVDQLKSKLEEIECSFSDKEAKILSTDLKHEYQRQLENIRNMRTLYEERSNLLLQENNVLKQQLGDKEHDLKTEMEKIKNLEEYIATLESNLNVKNEDIKELENELSQTRSDKLQTDEEMNAINNLISQILFDFNSSGNNVNLDMLHSMLEENREFLKEMAMKEDYGGIDAGSFLPKILYELFLQVHQKNSNDNSSENNEKQNVINTPEEIAVKLPKVWKILIELLNHQSKLKEELNAVDNLEKSIQTNCYKSVPTATGSQAVLSVSKTFIKLRDLIFEKRSLQKDTTRLKTLYSHLEQRLDKQEKKLSTVSLELTKTWHLVGKIKRQNRQLHTHEQILCYQLQQKRRVLNELKAELEYCRKKWALARAINKESEKQCQEMRHEFLLRKIQDQNSAESGYSDEHQSDGDECEKENLKCSKNEYEKRFEKNLSKFYQTPLYFMELDRRGSLESPLIFKLISEKESIGRRAQSEPPSNFNYKDYAEKTLSLPEHDMEEKSQASCIAVEVDTLEDYNSDSVMVTLPPNVHEFNKDEIRSIKIKTKLQNKRKQHKKKNKIVGNNAETAEQMFNRITASINCEVSTTSTSEEIDEELEHIEDIPLDSFNETQPENNDILKIQPEIMIPVFEANQHVESLENKDASTSSNDDYLTNREARLARLEAETKEFYEKMTRDKQKRVELDHRLTTVHQNFLDRQKDKSESANIEPSTSAINEESENSNSCDKSKGDDINRDKSSQE